MFWLSQNPIFNSSSQPGFYNSSFKSDYASDFFSFDSIVQIFQGSHPDSLLNSIIVQQYIRSKTPFLETFYTSDFFEFLNFSLTEKFYDFKSTDYIPVVFDFLNPYFIRVGTLSVDKNKVDELFDIYPDLDVELGVFEGASHDRDGDYYAHLSVPFEKFYYPEPYIASPSFVHEELWFIHILHYQHWLWFMFISLIMFYFITFINVVRWCNPRNKPRRETRGVSRSKCADLITACVPVSWALSIIISESVDAADYYDGFGTGEIIVGIRAYQWGWEYFYPKGIDLNYNVSPSFSSVVGNSLKYNNSNLSHSESNGFWKHYQNKNLAKVTNTPAHLILTPEDNSRVINFMDFDDLSLATHKNSSSFKKIQYFSKVNPQSLHSLNSDLSNKFDRLNTFFSSDDRLLESSNYKTYRQDMFTVNKSKFNNSTSFIDQKSFNKFIEYNSPHNKQSDDFLNFYNNRFIDRHSTHVTPTIGYDHLGSLNNINGALL